MSCPNCHTDQEQVLEHVFDEKGLCLCGYTKDEGTTPELTFVCPASLKRIDAGAFVGTAFTVVVLPRSIERIERETFAGANQLKDIYVPESVKFISESAIPLNPGLVGHGVKNSYAQTWAENHKLRFAEDYDEWD